MATYGQRFRAVRLGRGWKPGKPARLTQEAVAKHLGYKRPAPVSNLERSKLPKVTTVLEHARALRCDAWELLLGVPTAYDRLRWPEIAEPDLEKLLVGLKVMPREQRTAILHACAEAVAQLPDPLIQVEKRSGPSPTPVSAATTTQIGRGKKRA